jgi:hypothetical protein
MTRDELLSALLVERYATTERDLPAAHNDAAERNAWSNYTRGVRDPKTEDQIRAYRRRAMERSRARRKGAA